MRAAALVLVVALTPALARGERASRRPSPQETAAAREQFRAGLEAARAQRWEDARAAFERAYQLNPRPLILFNWASAEAQSQRPVEAAEHYRRFLRESDGAAPDTQRQRAAAQEALAKVEQEIAHVRITAAPLAEDDQIQLDGRALPVVTLGTSLPVNPGGHVVRVLRGGQVIAEARQVVKEGESASLTVAVEPEVTEPSVPAPEPPPIRPQENFAPATPSAVGALEARPEPVRRSVWRSPWVYVAAGVLVAAGVSAALWLGRGHDAQPIDGNLTPGRVTVR